MDENYKNNQAGLPTSQYLHKSIATFLTGTVVTVTMSQ